MKNVVKWFALTAIAAVTAFAMLSCGGGFGGGGITVTGIPPEYNGKYVFLQGEVLCYAGPIGKSNTMISEWKLSRISNGSVTTSVWDLAKAAADKSNKGEVPKYTGSDTIPFLNFFILDQETIGGAFGMISAALKPVVFQQFKDVTFTNGKAAVAYQNKKK